MSLPKSTLWDFLNKPPTWRKSYFENSDNGITQWFLGEEINHFDGVGTMAKELNITEATALKRLRSKKYWQHKKFKVKGE